MVLSPVLHFSRKGYNLKKIKIKHNKLLLQKDWGLYGGGVHVTYFLENLL